MHQGKNAIVSNKSRYEFDSGDTYEKEWVAAPELVKIDLLWILTIQY